MSIVFDYRGRPKAVPGWARHHRRVDEVAVQRAVDGEAIALGAAERQLAVAELTRQGKSINQIAARLGCSHETVSRCRKRARDMAGAS